MGRKRRFKPPIKLPPVNGERRGYKTRHTSVTQYGTTRPRVRKLPPPPSDYVPPPQFIRPKGGYLRHVEALTMGQAQTNEQHMPYVWRGLANVNARKLELRELKERPDLVDMDIVDRVGKRTYAPGTGPPIIRPEEQDSQAS